LSAKNDTTDYVESRADKFSEKYGKLRGEKNISEAVLDAVKEVYNLFDQNAMKLKEYVVGKPSVEEEAADQVKDVTDKAGDKVGNLHEKTLELRDYAGNKLNEAGDDLKQ